MDRRISMLLGLFAMLLAIAGARAFQLATLSSDKLAQAADTQSEATDNIPAPRGTITDRHGKVLAASVAADDVSVTPYLIENPPKTARIVAGDLGISEVDVLKAMTRTDTGFVYLARGVPGTKTAKLKKRKLPGLNFDPTMLREYPRQWVATQVVGSTNLEGKGLFGLEYAREKQLRGRAGVRKITRDATGEAVEVQDPTTTKPGTSLQLTLDAAIQDKTEQIMSELGAEYSPKSASAIVMDPGTGKLLAVANWPRVDAGNLKGTPYSAMVDQATNFTFEPGSTFKAFTMAGALQDGTVTPDTSFNLAPTIQVADREIGEAHERGWETMTTSQILAQSSNVGTITIAERMGKTRFAAWVKKFGFGKETGVDLPGEEQGMVIPPSQYSGSSIGNLPIGQGLLVTPMQLAQGYAAIANGGILRPPHVVDRVGGRPVREPRGHRVITPQTAASLREMLAGVFQAGGTAAAVQVPGYSLAGKTGTANKIDPKTGSYSKDKYVASFIGFAPAAAPKLLISVIVDEPKGDIYGGDVAAPAFGKIADFALPALRISP